MVVVIGPTRIFAGASLIAFSALLLAQGSNTASSFKAPRKGGASATLLSSPVTKDEVRKVFIRMDTAIKNVVPKYSAAPSHRLTGKDPATRDQIILQMDRVFQGSKPAFRFSPRKVEFDAKVLKTKDPAARRALENLVAWGFVGKVTPLATASTDTIGLKDFGDSVGFFMARLSELTHTPSSKFSPYMQRKGSD